MCFLIVIPYCNHYCSTSERHGQVTTNEYCAHRVFFCSFFFSLFSRLFFHYCFSVFQVSSLITLNNFNEWMAVERVKSNDTMWRKDAINYYRLLISQFVGPYSSWAHGDTSHSFQIGQRWILPVFSFQLLFVCFFSLNYTLVSVLVAFFPFSILVQCERAHAIECISCLQTVLIKWHEYSIYFTIWPSRIQCVMTSNQIEYDFKVSLNDKQITV